MVIGSFKNFCLYFILDDVSSFRYIQSIQEFTNIFVLDSCGLLNKGSRLTDGLDRIASDDLEVKIYKYLVDFTKNFITVSKINI